MKVQLYNDQRYDTCSMYRMRLGVRGVSAVATAAAGFAADNRALWIASISAWRVGSSSPSRTAAARVSAKTASCARTARVCWTSSYNHYPDEARVADSNCTSYRAIQTASSAACQMQSGGCTAASHTSPRSSHKSWFCKSHLLCFGHCLSMLMSKATTWH